MPADPRPDQADHGPVPALVLSELDWWKAALAGPDPLPDPAAAPRVDAAGVQLLAAALRWAPGRVALDLRTPSPLADLWDRLGLDDPADADPVGDDGCLLGFRLQGARA